MGYAEESSSCSQDWLANDPGAAATVSPGSSRREPQQPPDEAFGRRVHHHGIPGQCNDHPTPMLAKPGRQEGELKINEETLLLVIGEGGSLPINDALDLLVGDVEPDSIIGMAISHTEVIARLPQQPLQLVLHLEGLLGRDLNLNGGQPLIGGDQPIGDGDILDLLRVELRPEPPLTDPSCIADPPSTAPD